MFPTNLRINDGKVPIQEWRVVFITAILVMILTTLPYLIGYETQGDTLSFTGFVFGVEDGNSYIAKMLSGWAGSWTFQSPYTAFPQSGLFIFIPYLLLGKLAAPPALHDQLVAIYHLFRIGAGIALFAASYQLISRFISSRGLRLLALILVNLGGGLGWMLLFGKHSDWLASLPLDFYSPETFGFLGLFGLPHLVMARACMIWALLAYLDLFQKRKENPLIHLEFKSSLYAAVKLSVFWIFAGLFNPLALVIVGLVIFIHILGTFVYQKITTSQISYAWKQILFPLGAASLIPGCYLFYFIAITLWDPFARQWAVQNQIISPDFPYFLLAYGLMIPYVIAGAIVALRIDFSKSWLLVGWVIIVPALVYAPTGLQRRLTEGVWVAICILSILALDYWKSERSKRMHRFYPFIELPLGLAFPSAIIFLIGGLATARSPFPPIFLPRDQTETFDFLQAEVESQDVVLAAYSTGNALPAWAPVKVLAGHGPESIFSGEIYPDIKAFYQASTDDLERLKFIKRFGIQDIFWGPEEKKLGKWNPASASYLESLFVEGEYSVFRVRGFVP